MLFVACFGFGACFHLSFVAFCCSSLLVLVFEIESVLSQKPKTGKCFWLLVLVFCRCFHFNFAWLVLAFLGGFYESQNVNKYQ